MDTGKSALGLDGNVAAALGYPIGIIAIICLVMEKENRFVKFHALQSILYHVAAAITFVAIVMVLAILMIVLSMISHTLAALSSLLWLLYLLVVIAYVIGLIYTAVKAYNGEKYMLPVVGNLAEKWTK
jgi:uncharacterized membrane protein